MKVIYKITVVVGPRGSHEPVRSPGAHLFRIHLVKYRR